MKIAAGTVLPAGAILTTIGLAAIILAACAGPEGNPNPQPYADDQGGAVAVKPTTIGTVRYDPYDTREPFVEKQVGQPAINPPLPMSSPSTKPPLRSR